VMSNKKIQNTKKDTRCKLIQLTNSAIKEYIN